MSDATTEHTVLSREHARIDSTLEWYFNFGEGDVGLRRNHAATVAVLISRKNRDVANADAAEEAMFRAIEAVTRHRAVSAVSAVLARLSERDRLELRQCYAARRWRGELAERPVAHRGAPTRAIRSSCSRFASHRWEAFVTAGAGQAMGFRVKALYTVPELATLIGMHHRTLRRWLAKKPVPLLHVGGSVAVPLIAFREAFPEVWAFLKAVHELRQACPVRGETVEP